MTEKNEMTVFLVDDDDVVCESVIRSFKKLNISFPIITAADGQEALDVLRGAVADKALKRPFVILLDLNMPRMNGFEFLNELRSDPDLSTNVVFVLTTSNDDNDRARAYQEHIAGYMVKSAVGPQFSHLASLLSDYKSAITLPAK